MKKETVAAILEAADEIGLEMKEREGYSGRGMYGKDTVGIVLDSENDLLVSVATAAIRLKEKEDELEDAPGTLTVEEFLDDIKRIRRDNMGRDSIIVY